MSTISYVLSPSLSLYADVSALAPSAYQRAGTPRPDDSAVNGTGVGHKRRSGGGLHRQVKNLSGHQHKRARALNGQGSQVEPKPCHNREAMNMASPKTTANISGQQV